MRVMTTATRSGVRAVPVGGDFQLASKPLASISLRQAPRTSARSSLWRGRRSPWIDSRAWRLASMFQRPQAPMASVIANTRRSHSAWNIGSSGSGEMGPRPCIAAHVVDTVHTSAVPIMAFAGDEVGQGVFRQTFGSGWSAGGRRGSGPRRWSPTPAPRHSGAIGPRRIPPAPRAGRSPRGNGRHSTCTRSAAGPAPTTDSRSTGCRRRGCGPSAVFSTAIMCSPCRPEMSSSAMAEVASSNQTRAISPDRSTRLATTREPFAGSDLVFVGIDDRIEGGGVDQPLFGQHGLQRLDPQGEVRRRRPDRDRGQGGGADRGAWHPSRRSSTILPKWSPASHRLQRRAGFGEGVDLVDHRRDAVKLDRPAHRLEHGPGANRHADKFRRRTDHLNPSAMARPRRPAPRLWRCVRPG